MIQSIVSSLLLWLLLLVMLTIVNLIIFNFKDIFSLFKNIQKKTWIFLLIIFVLGFILRFVVVAHMHNLHYDEDAYIDNAKHISLNWNNCLCLYNLNGDCKFCGFSFKSIGFSFILGLFFKVFGISSTVGFYVSSFFGSLTILVLFLFSYLLFKKEDVALFSSLVLAVYPLHIRWSGSATAEIVSLFFIILTFLFMFIYFEIPRFKFLLLSVIILIFSISVKEENLLLLPFFLIFFFVKRFSKKSRYTALVILLVLLIPFIIGNLFLQQGKTIENGYAGSRYTFWKEGNILSFEFLLKNIVPNLFFLIDKTYTLLIVILFFFVGIFTMWIKQRKVCIVLVSWLLAMTALFSAFLKETLQASEVRHYIPSLITIIILTGYGISWFSKINFIRRIKGTYIIIGIILASFIVYIPYITSYQSPVLSAQQDYELLISHLKDIPRDCLILTPESYVPDFFDRSSLSIYLLDRYNISTTCNYYYESEICYREAKNVCDKMRTTYNLELMFTNNRHRLYKLIGNETHVT